MNPNSEQIQIMRNYMLNLSNMTKTKNWKQHKINEEIMKLNEWIVTNPILEKLKHEQEINRLQNVLYFINQ